jgi:outer membrane protein assembly factor BamA
MLRRGIAAALLALAASAAFAQPATESLAGRRIGSVAITLERQPTSDPALLDLIETRQGEPLSLAEVRETITHLYSLARFQDVQVDAAAAPDGAVALVYNLVPIHAVERVEFRGTLGLSQSLLRDTVTDRFGRTPQPGRSAEVIRTLERLYQDHGYFNATIRAEAQELHDPDSTILTFDINAGPVARVRGIELRGNPPTPREDLLARLELAPGRPYERVELQERLTDYAEQVKRRGYLQAAASHSARISEDGTAADIVLDVQAGPIVSVTFAGDPIPAARREELAPFEREGSVDEDLLEDSAQRLRDYLRQEGYWKADVTFEPRQSDGKLDIVFMIRKGPVYRVSPEGVDISGNEAVRIEEIRPLVVLNPGDPYIASHLDATVGALLALYRTRGFAWADVKTAANEVPTPGGYGGALVRPAIVIAEGPRATIGDIRIEGAKALGEPEIRRVLNLQRGTAYYEPTVRTARDSVQLEYLNLGFASAQVAIAPAVSEDRSRVDLTVAITEGPQTFVDHVIVIGNRRTSEDVIRREVLLRPGAPLGLRDLLESRRRLSALGLFRRFDIRELEHGPPTRRDVLVTVEEAPATTVGYGGGLELTRRLREGAAGEAEERIELAPRGFFDIGRRNLWGKNRSVNLFTRVSIRPRDEPDDPGQDGTGLGLSEYRFVGTYREPRAFQWNADFTLAAAVEQGVRSSFNFTRKGVTAELVRRLTPTIRSGLRYSFGTTRTFDERLEPDEQARIDRLFPQVRLSIFTGALARDTRDDVVEPTAGAFLSGEGAMATRGLGGQVGFLKTYVQGYWFKRVPRTRGAVFATRASIGLADGFPREAQATDADGQPIPGVFESIEDLPASERFFAGGDTTIRGYALDTVGAPKTISPRGFPRGGNGLLILNAELRVPVWKEVGAVVFVDGGNVWERATDFDIGELRGSFGFGLRYRSPIGPVRVDLGFKMDRREIGGNLEKRSVLHFAIGQAF